MDLDDFFDGKLAAAVAVTATVASPTVRKTLRRGVVYGVAGLLVAGDRLTSMAQSISESARSQADDNEAPASETSEGVARKESSKKSA